MTVSLLLGDCLEQLAQLPACSIDACVTDPPYGIRFMGKAWDGADIERRYQEANSREAGRVRTGMAAAAGKYDRAVEASVAFEDFSRAWAAEVLRVLKPGGHLLAFAGTRTYHRMVCGVEDAGFEVRDQIGWAFGSGFPKSHNGPWGGTALKPAWEPIVVARKPLDGTVEANWKAHGTGALNIDGCRIGVGEGGERNGEASSERRYTDHGGTNFAATPGPRGGDARGRWPANLIHDGSDEVVALFPDSEVSGSAKSGTVSDAVSDGMFGTRVQGTLHNDTGSAARFYYCAKADRRDRDEGLELQRRRTVAFSNQALAEQKRGNVGRNNDNGLNSVKVRGNHHPTVKPTDLMRYLVRLVTPAGGVVLDPFMGSGSTGKDAVLEQRAFIGIEREPDYVEIARARIAFVQAEPVAPEERDTSKAEQGTQFSLLGAA